MVVTRMKKTTMAATITILMQSHSTIDTKRRASALAVAANNQAGAKDGHRGCGAVADLPSTIVSLLTTKKRRGTTTTTPPPQTPATPRRTTPTMTTAPADVGDTAAALATAATV
jgi:hypothetical protein